MIVIHQSLLRQAGSYIRPESFIQGQQYILLESQPCSLPPISSPVQFVGYAPCPATVVVLDNENRKIFVPRANLFTFNNPRS